MDRIFILFIAFLACLSCKDRKLVYNSIDRVESLSRRMFDGEIVGTIAKSGKREKAGVIFNIASIPPGLKCVLNKARSKRGYIVSHETRSFEWISATETWRVISDDGHRSYNLKMAENGCLITVFLVEN